MITADTSRMFDRELAIGLIFRQTPAARPRRQGLEAHQPLVSVQAAFDTLSLCHKHHMEFHEDQATWEGKHGPQSDHVERTQAILKMSPYERAIYGE